MAQHKRSNRDTLRSALKHKVAADTILDSIDELAIKIVLVESKIAADANGTWDTDYEASHAVTEVDMDAKSIGQHKRSIREVLKSSMSHKRLANEIADTIEEAQVSLNAVLVKMDAGAGTLDAVDANWDALAVVNLIDADAKSVGQHKRSLRETIRSAVSHKQLGDFIIDTLALLENGVNGLIEDIKAKN